jgi:hypothetical protein
MSLLHLRAALANSFFVDLMELETIGVGKKKGRREKKEKFHSRVS